MAEVINEKGKVKSENAWVVGSGLPRYIGRYTRLYTDGAGAIAKPQAIHLSTAHRVARAWFLESGQPIPQSKKLESALLPPSQVQYP